MKIQKRLPIVDNRKTIRCKKTKQKLYKHRFKGKVSGTL